MRNFCTLSFTGFCKRTLRSSKALFNFSLKLFPLLIWAFSSQLGLTVSLDAIKDLCETKIFLNLETPLNLKTMFHKIATDLYHHANLNNNILVFSSRTCSYSLICHLSTGDALLTFLMMLQYFSLVYSNIWDEICCHHLILFYWVVHAAWKYHQRMYQQPRSCVSSFWLPKVHTSWKHVYLWYN